MLLAGCVSDRRYSTARAGSNGEPANTGQTAVASPQNEVSYWNGDSVVGPPRIQIDLGEQRAYFFKGDQLVGVARVSTGRADYRTPAGRFTVLDKDIDHISGLYGNFVDADGQVVMKDVGVRTHQPPPGARFSGAPMPYFIRFHGGIGMHAGYLPGYPASHGCVRLPRHMAGNFFHHADVGTPIEVVN
ncbi:MAG TPA: L,D-transpeptidase [Chthoniobacteraceae bacterium]|nr:L,D-transpeptidase [Chthoniobacteraceae bacterium]